MKTVQEAFLEIVFDRIDDHLTWLCKDCPKIEECEDHADVGEGRYCRPLIQAAILGEDSFETKYKKGNG